MHALLGAGTRSRRVRHDAAHPLDVDLLVVDEASMVHLEMMDALLDALPDDARLVLLGDKDQLSSVEAGAVLGDLCADAERGRYRPETADDWELLCGQRPPLELLDAAGPPLAQALVMLRRSRRFGGALGEFAAAIRRGDAAAAQGLLDDDGVLRWCDGAHAVAALATDTSAASYASYLECARAGVAAGETHEAWAARVLAAFDRFRVLCAVHDGPWGDDAVNAAIEDALAARGWIAPRQPWYVGRPLIATRNDRDLGVFNGDVGVVLPDPQRRGALRAYFAAAGGVRSIAAARLHAVQTAYAMTVHKSQGSEFEHAVLVLPDRAPGLSRELVYTAVTRARERVSVVGAQRETLSAAIARRVQRASGLRDRLEAGG
ncbi:RecBCD enzyme subunit RecD [mine drainage metagenome]|uniref:RecBCD enzyme subunit RecD n=1 Tax=mine drainage metagenome TaxID=410659 RepID=A0A1J5PLL7_9ZZZZ